MDLPQGHELEFICNIQTINVIHGKGQKICKAVTLVIARLLPVQDLAITAAIKGPFAFAAFLEIFYFA
jgi:hypothetical protein